MHKNRFKFISKICFRLIFLFIVCLMCLRAAEAQISHQQNEDNPPYDSPKKPVNCETAYNFINDALTRYDDSKSGYFIIIARLGDGEFSRRSNLNRIKTLKSYISILKQPVKAVFAEGERVKGFGVIEIYVGGKLLYSLPLGRSEGLDLKTCLAV